MLRFTTTHETWERYMAGKKPQTSTPADQRISGRGQKPGPKPAKGTQASKGKSK